jgi:hypothetical protein
VSAMDWESDEYDEMGRLITGIAPQALGCRADWSRRLIASPSSILPGLAQLGVEDRSEIAVTMRFARGVSNGEIDTAALQNERPDQ